MKKMMILAGAALTMAACGNSEKAYDATGTFEATEITVFAEQSGVLLAFDVNEGDTVAMGREVGLIDTTQTWLKIQQLGATKEVYQTQKPDMERQIAVTRQQLAKAKQEEQARREAAAAAAAAAAAQLPVVKPQRRRLPSFSMYLVVLVFFGSSRSVIALRHIP